MVRLPAYLLIAAAAALWAGCGEDAACNGDERLCQRGLDEVALACTHNAMASAEAGWPAPNHRDGPLRQLRDGVRALMLDLHYWSGEVALCHGPCALGNIPLRQFLDELRGFLLQHPREVVVLILESYVDRVDVARALAAARLDAMVHAQKAGAPWPALGQMIARGHRLVILSDRQGGVYPWYHRVWDHAWETNWNNKDPAKLSCKRNRGKASNPLFILNHFVSAPLPDEQVARKINARDFLLARARQCQQESGRLPNFVTVDFHHVGDLMAVVRELNELR